MSLLKTVGIGVLVTVIGGVILLQIEDSFYSEEVSEIVPSNSQIAEPASNSKVTQVAPKPNKPSNVFYIQTRRAYDLFDGKLSLTLKNTLNFANSSADLVLSTIGNPPEHFDNLSIGDKVFFEQYELTFVGTEKNIMTYDIRVKIIEK
ncbi:hypothetical protein ACWOKN_004341 [Vibrio vulnificus]|nr:hypothetical protein [Vibrio vulnificus]